MKNRETDKRKRVKGPLKLSGGNGPRKGNRIEYMDLILWTDGKISACCREFRAAGLNDGTVTKQRGFVPDGVNVLGNVEAIQIVKDRREQERLESEGVDNAG